MIPNRIILTTGNEINGYSMEKYYGLVFGEVVIPNGLLGALTQGTFFTIDALTKARVEAVNNMADNAYKKSQNINAIIGIDIDVSDLNGKAILVSANGTAVELRKNDDSLALTNESSRFEISAMNNIPFGIKNIEIVNQSNTTSKVSLEISADDIQKIEGIQCSIQIENCFGDVMNFENLGFVNLEFIADSSRKKKTEYVECNIGADDIRLAKKVNIIVSKYISDGEVLSIKDNTLSADNVNLYADNEIKIREMFDEFKELKTTREIYNRIVDFEGLHPGTIDDAIIKYVEKSVMVERLYGNTYDNTMSYLKKELLDNA